MVDSQPMEEEFQGVATRDVGTTTHREPTEPVLQTQKNPSPSLVFIKENTDVLRIMIKENNQQAKIKATPRKLAYADSNKETPALSLAKGFSDRFSLESFGTSDTYRQTRSVSKSQKTPSKNKESIHLRRSRRGLRISAFMHGHGHSKLAKKLNYKIPKTVDEMFERVRALIREEVAAGSAEIFHPSQRDKGYVRPAWPKMSKKAINRGGPREARRNMGVYAPYPRKDTFTSLIKTPKEILAMERVSFPEPPPLIETPKKQNLNKFCDYHEDRGYNTNDCYQLKKQIEEAIASGKLAHLVKDIRWNNQWNGNQGRNIVKIINMIREEGNHKRPFEEGSSGLMSKLTFPAIPQSQLTDEPIILEGIKVQGSNDRFFGRNLSPPRVNKSSSNHGNRRKKARSNSGRRPGLGPASLEKTRSKKDIEEVFTISHKHPDQYVTMGAKLKTNCKQLLADILWKNIEIFAWTRSESTAVLRFVIEHQLKIYPLTEPMVHKRRLVAPEGRLALKERVFYWLGEALIRNVRHLEWITNAIPIKLENGTWKVQMDYSSLNKACSKDMYPFLEEGKELASLMGYPYKCFLRLSKEYSQIRMAEDDEEKIRFYTEEGVYCFTHMPKDLKNSTATLHRMMKKSNGKFLGHMVTEEGLRADPERIHAIILSPTLKSPNQIQSLFLQLTAISKFIPKLAELKHPLREARTRIETAKEVGWTNEAEKALRRIKRNRQNIGHS
uniref:Reverse transcriptase domain-containing protein n=1 Tax=Tanacetum cinerariifolium TaxID=118510 RepID=A0A6L2MUI9_TANCI|nr:hypothetical protein [Tanacetum cinerariifolium]